MVLMFFAIPSLAEDISAVADPTANAERRDRGIVTFSLDNSSTSRAVAMDLRNQREVKIGLAAASVTQFGISTGGRPFYGGDFDGNDVWYVVATPDTLYSVDTTTGVFTQLGRITGLPAASNTSGLTWDYSTNTMYLCNLVGGVATLYTLNLTTRVATSVGPILTGTVIDIAANNSGQLYGIRFAPAQGVSDSLISINKLTGAGTTIGPLGVDVNFAHGLDFDPATDSLFYPGYIGAGVNNLYRINTQTGQAQLIGPLAAGEYDAFAVMGRPAGGGSDTLLVILQDSTTGTADQMTRKRADRDSLFKYLAPLVPTYHVVYIDTNAARFPDLTNYKRVLYNETSFDAAISQSLKATARTALKNWLNAGTASDMRKLIMVGADLGYNYSRTGGSGLDTVLSHVMLKFQYRLDNGNVTGQNSITGVAVIPGTVVPYTTTPPGAGFWPDGCLPRPGGTVLFRYTGRTANDTVAGVGYASTGYISACLFQDPRYFTGGFGTVLQALLQYSGVITDVRSPQAEIPTRFQLAQNYPNPFNPTTTIRYSLPEAAGVNLSIYNVLGQHVIELTNELQHAGAYNVLWDGRNMSGMQVASGVYFYRLEAKPASGSAPFITMKKMMLVK